MKNLQQFIISLAISVAPAAALADDIDVRRDIASDATVSVSNIAGSIEITTWSRNEVHLTGETGPNQELIVTESDQGIRFEIREIEKKSYSGESDLELVVPATASIVAIGVSADITISGSRGARLTAESVSGDVEVEADVGRADLESVSGDVLFRGSAERTYAESVSGDVEIHGVGGEVDVQSVSGDAIVFASIVTLGKFESVSGSLELDLEAADGGRLTIATMSGDVILNLPASQSAEFSAQSFSGDIDSRFGEVKHEKYGPGSHLKYSSGNSGTVIRVESFSGDIDIDHK
ncbi:MAG: DUF4097 family beta strand repeat protein [Xanthomonadales bacterium]|nr:DUF4097 family beta strand repeat protein [Xanthomonadales bacterium]